ncbi:MULTISPECIES: hypothetical protein [Vibrio]|uniref:hypothetical protein n=1 Tax=Vibrio TaxID=662 RepID=UPI001EFE0889|nr:hypothetical protein [Vibrio chagasii]MCG9568874.1 hypothetical protein [Vibrio chagasii]
MTEVQIKYLELMRTIRDRFHAIDRIITIEENNFYMSEAIAFHARKVIEAIAFSCLIAIENGINVVPKSAKGQYNAEKIFKALKKQNLSAIQNPSFIRAATDGEKRMYGISTTIEGRPEKCLNHQDLIKIYQELHSWLHELNPYVKSGHREFNEKNYPSLLDSVSKLRSLLTSHVMTVRGVGFYCVLDDKNYNDVRMVCISKSGKT